MWQSWKICFKVEKVIVLFSHCECDTIVISNSAEFQLILWGGIILLRVFNYNPFTGSGRFNLDAFHYLNVTSGWHNIWHWEDNMLMCFNSFFFNFMCVMPILTELDRAQRLEERERILREIWMNGQPDISTVTQSLNRYYWHKTKQSFWTLGKVFLVCGD